MKWTLALLLSVAVTAWAGICHAQQASLKTIHTAQRQFAIPFQFDTAEMERIGVTEVRLYVSVDGGGKWQQVQSVAPQTGRFYVRSPKDGVYWFAVRTVGRDQRQHPVGERMEPEIKVVVDSTIPELKIHLSQPEVGQIQLRWSMTGGQIKASTLQLESLQEGRHRWSTVYVAKKSTGSTRWKVPAGGLVKIRGRVIDQDGNVITGQNSITIAPVSEKVPRQPVPHLKKPTTVPSTFQERPQMPKQFPGNSDSSTSRPLFSAPPSSVPTTSASPMVISPKTGSQNAGSLQIVPKNTAGQSLGGHTTTSGHQNNGERNNGEQRHQVISFPNQPQQLPNVRPQNVRPQNVRPQNNKTQDDESQFVTIGKVIHSPTKTEHEEPAKTTQQNGLTAAPTVVLPPIPTRIVEQRRFEINYHVDKIGTSGVQSVELFVTQNGGKKWYRYGTDNDRVSPFPVVVPHDGSYGFIVRVKSGAGLSVQPPQPGDRPSISVVVDQTAPHLKMLPVLQGTGADINRFLIRWNSSDVNPIKTPISIAYATQPNGPWVTIVSDKPNVGKHLWTVDSNVPPNVYIRVTARDKAGNQAQIRTRRPMIIDVIRPSAKITDVNSAN